MATQVDVVIISPRQRRLHVLLGRDSRTSRRGRALPNGALRARETLDAAAARICRSVSSLSTKLVRQVRAIETGRSAARVAVGYLAVCADADGGVAPDFAWVPVDDARPLPAYQRALVAGAVDLLRGVDDPNLAFAMLPPRFTLAELQRVNEMISGRKLHKASFRRSLISAKLVEATDARRVEGRGRPARVFRFVGRDA